MSQQGSNGGTFALSTASQTRAGAAPGHHRQPALAAAWDHLSPREREVLALLAARWTDREIAETLYISYRTVTTHVSNIYDKLGIHSRREAAMFALAHPETRPVPAWPQVVLVDSGA